MEDNNSMDQEWGWFGMTQAHYIYFYSQVAQWRTWTVLPMQPVRTLGKGMPEPAAPDKSMPNLWPVGTLEDGLSPGTP